MSLRDRPLRERARYPVEFDLEGVPRDRFIREELLKTRTGERMANHSEVIDINNPPKEPYVYREFPKLMYDHSDAGRVLTVHDAEEEKQAKRKGYKEKPSPRHDYSLLNSNSRAPLKAVEPVEAPMEPEPDEEDQSA